MSPGDSNTKPAVLSTVRLNDLTVVAGLEPWLIENKLDSFDRLFDSTTGELLSKPGLMEWRERIRLTIRQGGQEQTLYLKRYRDPPASALRELRRMRSGVSSLAALEWTRMCQLADDGIPCVKPVAFGEELISGRERRSAILTMAVPGRSLESWACEWTDADRGTINTVSKRVAQVVAQMHGAGFVHRDLYLSHLFYDASSEVTDSVHLIDLQRVLRNPRLFRRWVVKDLASLNYSTPAALFSTTDRVRWLKWYLGAITLDGPMKRLIHKITGKTRRIARHDARRRARLAPPGATAT